LIAKIDNDIKGGNLAAIDFQQRNVDGVLYSMPLLRSEKNAQYYFNGHEAQPIKRNLNTSMALPEATNISIPMSQQEQQFLDDVLGVNMFKEPTASAIDGWHPPMAAPTNSLSVAQEKLKQLQPGDKTRWIAGDQEFSTLEEARQYAAQYAAVVSETKAPLKPAQVAPTLGAYIEPRGDYGLATAGAQGMHISFSMLDGSMNLGRGLYYDITEQNRFVQFKAGTELKIAAGDKGEYDLHKFGLNGTDGMVKAVDGRLKWFGVSDEFNRAEHVIQGYGQSAVPGLTNERLTVMRNLAVGVDADLSGNDSWKNLKKEGETPVVTMNALVDAKGNKVQQGVTAGVLDATSDGQLSVKEVHGLGNANVNKLLQDLKQDANHLWTMADSGEVMRSIGPVQKTQSFTLAPDPQNIPKLIAARDAAQALGDTASAEIFGKMVNILQDIKGNKFAPGDSLHAERQKLGELWIKVAPLAQDSRLLTSGKTEGRQLYEALNNLSSAIVPQALLGKDNSSESTVKPNNINVAQVTFLPEYQGKAAVGSLGKGARTHIDLENGAMDLGRGLAYNVVKEGYAVALRGTANYGFREQLDKGNYTVAVTARFGKNGMYGLKEIEVDGKKSFVPHLEYSSAIWEGPSLTVGFSTAPGGYAKTIQDGLFKGTAILNPGDQNL